MALLRRSFRLYSPLCCPNPPRYLHMHPGTEELQSETAGSLPTDSKVGGSVTAIFNVITDLYILTLPLSFVWSLHMKMGPKMRLTALFGLGVVYEPHLPKKTSHCQSIYPITKGSLIEECQIT